MRKGIKQRPLSCWAILVTASGKFVSTLPVGIHEWLHEDDLSTMRPVICESLTSRHRKECLSWTHHHVHSTADQWNWVLFTNGFQFSLQDYINQQTFVKRIRIEEDMSLFVMVYLCVGIHTSMSFYVEQRVLGFYIDMIE